MALADDIALYTLGYWTHEQHPFRINSICLNTKQRKSPCRACTDVCPEGIVLHSGKALWKQCTNCNLCVTACPTAAINQSSTSFESVKSLILEHDAPVSFACQRVTENCDVRCTCLATIPWDLAAAAALEGGAVLKAQACQNCPHANFVEQVKELIRTLRHFLGKEHFAQTVFMHDQPDMMRGAGADKRFAFNRLASNVAHGAEAAFEGQKQPTMSCYRALLLDVIAQHEEAGTGIDIHWPTLVEDGNCIACEICTKMCPHHALELFVEGYSDKDTEGAENTPTESLPFPQVLIHDASKCTQCGLCYVSCPQENLGGWDMLTSSSVPALTYYPISVELCEKCGRPFKPADETSTLCATCGRPKFSVGH